MPWARSTAHRRILKFLVLTFFRISGVTRANGGARDVPYKRSPMPWRRRERSMQESGHSLSYFSKALRNGNTGRFCCVDVQVTPMRVRRPSAMRYDPARARVTLPPGRSRLLTNPRPSGSWLGLRAEAGRARDYSNIAATNVMTAAKITKAVAISVRSRAGGGSGSLRIASRACIAAASAWVIGDGVGIALNNFIMIGDAGSGPVH